MLSEKAYKAIHHSGCYAAAALPSQPAYIVDTHGVSANIAQQHVVKKHAYKVENERLRKADGQVLGRAAGDTIERHQAYC